MKSISLGSDVYQFLMTSGTFAVFRKIKKEEANPDQLRLFGCGCDCDTKCSSCSDNCSCKNNGT